MSAEKCAMVSKSASYLAEMVAISIKRLSKIEATDDPSDAVDDE